MEPEAKPENPSIVDEGFIDMFNSFLTTDLTNDRSVQPCAYFFAPGNKISALRELENDHTAVVTDDEPLPDDGEEGMNIVVMPLLSFGSDEQKDRSADMMREVAAKVQAHAVVFTSEIWMLTDESSEQDKNDVMFGRKSVSECDTKAEAIMLTIEEPGTVTHMFAQKLWSEGDGVGVPTLGAWVRKSMPAETVSGRMSNILPCNAERGMSTDDMREKIFTERRAELEQIIREYAAKARAAFESADEATRHIMARNMVEFGKRAMQATTDEERKAISEEFMAGIQELVGEELPDPKMKIGTFETIFNAHEA